MEKMSNGTKEKITVKPHISKRRAVVSYANMNPEVTAAFKEKYPKGYSDYMGEIIKVDKPDGTFFYAVSVELPDAIYLVKIEVKVDDYEEAEQGLFGGVSNDDEMEESDEFPEDDSGGAFSEEEESDD
jgi:hypothetical protein